jgi:hypothetical protein
MARRYGGPAGPGPAGRSAAPGADPAAPEQHRERNVTVSTAQEHPAGPVDPAAQVTVVLDGCGTDDARTVLEALQASFPSDRDTADRPAEVEEGRPSVWTATFDVSRTLGLPGPAHLSQPVTATVQGGYRVVDRIREGLAEAFAVRVVGTASGDQEQEAQFRLESR